MARIMAKIKNFTILTIITIIIGVSALGSWVVYKHFIEENTEFKFYGRHLDDTMQARSGFKLSDYDKSLVYAEMVSFRLTNNYTQGKQWHTDKFYVKVTFLDKNIEMIESYFDASGELYRPFALGNGEAEQSRYIDIEGKQAIYINTIGKSGGFQGVCVVLTGNGGREFLFRFTTSLSGDGKRAELIDLARQIVLSSKQ